MHFTVTYCSCGLLHMWCSGDYLQHEDGVCWIDFKQCVCVFMVMMKRRVFLKKCILLFLDISGALWHRSICIRL